MANRILLSGNEAIAEGALEAGAHFAAAYPGTPSTEILETLSRRGGIRAEWAPNEKVAYETAYGASLGGARALVAMKHVGVNVAADPLFSSSYAGVNGGLVLVSADDPAMHSSQNEQDNRQLARAAKIPVIEPSDSQEAKDFTRIAFEISERFDTPVMLRVTTRICHSMSPVAVKRGTTWPMARIPDYSRNFHKHVLLPANARPRHDFVESRMLELEEYAASNRDLNRIEWGDRTVGVVTGGVAYQYVREVLPGASVLKLGMPWPLPRALVRELAAGVDELYVVEELDPFIETEVRALGVQVLGKEIFPLTGELNPDVVARGFELSGNGTATEPGDVRQKNAAPAAIPPRPPVLCAGCGHRGVFFTLSKMGLIVTGDIGCYTLGALHPLESMDACLCMGASIGMAHGMEAALRAAGDERRVVGVIGDSTFMHSGITGLINTVYNGVSSTVLVLDNGTTAMTGHQDHPGTGVTATGERGQQVDIEAVCRAVGVRRVRNVDPYDIAALEAALNEELDTPEPSVIICRAACRLVDRTPIAPSVRLEIECPGCGTCFELGCPAIDDRDGVAVIDAAACCGCGLCVQVCPFCGLRIEGHEPAGVP
ncbi:MAG: indolepyruvate ferredoxin oxidoreductase subunit alpha [marine benthic group bacterium]|nr:indolepyruvate ferredoxin oxidoreductase subunit alpha [Gemmatimonadota bacterium]